MAALILVVDDHEQNIEQLQAKLANEYYGIVTARNGYEAMLAVKQHNPDLIIIDVMMPGMDGFELCRRLKADPVSSHIPVIMVTGLHSSSDRIRGLDAGADDFMTRPINDIVFFARTKSLIRMKMLLDELRLREDSVRRMDGVPAETSAFRINVSGSTVLLVDDDAEQVSRLSKRISAEYQFEHADSYESAQEKALRNPPDVILISSQITGLEGVRLASHLKGREETRHIPIIIMVQEERAQTMLKALELGINDYLLLPIEPHEMMARLKIQIRRKKYQELLRNSYTSDETRVIKDKLTSLYNRQFMDAHLSNQVTQFNRFGKPFTMVMVDVDHLTKVNTEYGIGVGDEILQAVAKVLMRSIRSADMAARFAGEQFIVLLPYTDLLSASVVTDRIRKTIAATLFPVHHEVHGLNITVSIGAAQCKKGEDMRQFFLRVESALKTAKVEGRNQVHLAPRN